MARLRDGRSGRTRFSGRKPSLEYRPLYREEIGVFCGDRHPLFAFDHRQFQLGGRIDEKVQLDILVAPLEARQRIAETGLGQGREIVRQAQVQLPDQTSG